MLTLRRGCGGCGSCLLWFVIVALLTASWVSSNWALRGLELAGLAVVVVVAGIYQQHHRPTGSGEAVPATQRAARTKTAA
jgi:hypothetical protein